MDQLVALVALRWKSDLRLFLRGRERAVGLLLAAPGLLFAAAFGSLIAFFGARALESGLPEGTLPILSALATGAGLFWALSPLVAGVAFTEAHDVSRLLHFPLRPSLLVASSLAANLTQPMVLAEIPVLMALSVGLAGAPGLVLALPGLALSFLTVLVAAHAAQVGLTGLARNRRFQDLALAGGLGLAVLMSALPLILFAAGARRLKPAFAFLVDHDPFALSPFAWGARSAVHATRGDLGSAALWALLACGAIAAGVALSAALTVRMSRGELALGSKPKAESRPARQWLGGAWGALVEKDLRLAWRDPALKVALGASLIGPAVMLLVFSGAPAGARPRGLGLLVALSMFVGFGGFSNLFGFERRGVLLLFGFPVDRLAILLAKTAVALVLRLPSLLLVAIAAVFLADLALIPVALAGTLCVALVAGSFDAWLSVLFPMPVPPPGGNPYGGTSAGRGFGAVATSLLTVPLTLMMAAPFLFLAWLPHLLGQYGLFAVSLPLALLGAAGTHAIVVAGAARSLARRERTVIERVLAEV
jgi:hypothetical protein